MADHLTCLVRKIAVQATPEERVRQETLHHLTPLFPLHVIAVELSLKKLCPTQKIPNRRVDIVCFAPNCPTLTPSLLIECKASRPTKQIFEQLLGYNYFVKAQAIALAWPGHISIRQGKEILYEGKIQEMPPSLFSGQNEDSL